MFSTLSMGGTGGLITLIELVLHWFNVELPGGVVADAINGLITFLGAIWLVWGTIRARRDLKLGLVRK